MIQSFKLMYTLTQSTAIQIHFEFYEVTNNTYRFDHFLLLGEESRGLETLGEAAATGVLSVGAELLLNPQQLIVLGQALRTGRSSGLDLTKRSVSKHLQKEKSVVEEA